jgi:hypothetical protein
MAVVAQGRGSLGMSTFTRGSLLDIEHLQAEEITGLLRLARRMQRGRPRPLLRGKTVGLVFYEASTRTRTSFEMAARGWAPSPSWCTPAAPPSKKASPCWIRATHCGQ